MTKNRLILEAEYMDIMLGLMEPPYEVSSISKLVFMTFCVKYETDMPAYRNRKKDFVDIFFKNISLKLSAHSGEIAVIIRLVDMLKKTGAVVIEGDNIMLNFDKKHEVENNFLKFCRGKMPNPLIEINKLDPKALIEEVIRFV